MAAPPRQHNQSPSRALTSELQSLTQRLCPSCLRVPPLRCHHPTTAKTNYNIDKLFELVAEKVKPGQGASQKKRVRDPLKDDAGGGKPSCC